MTNKKDTVVYFHIGRGGRFNNAGHATFCGRKDIEQVLQSADESGQWNFIVRQNEYEIAEKIEGKENLKNLFEKCRAIDDFSEFEKRTGFELGEKIYVDCNGSQLITLDDAERGIGTLDWDGEYDTDVCMFLSDCDENDLRLILENQESECEDLIEEYFDENTDLNIDWKKFNGNYEDLITEYFHFPNVDVKDFYNEEEND